MLDVGHLLAIGPVGYILRSLGLHFVCSARDGAVGVLAIPTNSRRPAMRVDVDALYLADDEAGAGDIGAGVGLGKLCFIDIAHDGIARGAQHAKEVGDIVLIEIGRPFFFQPVAQYLVYYG
jgi:hypothetical protein